MSLKDQLKEDMKHSNKEIAKMIKDDTSSLNCDISVNESTMDMGSMVGSGINIQIKGDNSVSYTHLKLPTTSRV